MEPGTVVDTHIVHPKELDFYLVSNQNEQITKWSDNSTHGGSSGLFAVKLFGIVKDHLVSKKTIITPHN